MVENNKINLDYEFVKSAFTAGFNTGCTLQANGILNLKERNLLCEKWHKLWIKKYIKDT